MHLHDRNGLFKQPTHNMTRLQCQISNVQTQWAILDCITDRLVACKISIYFFNWWHNTTKNFQKLNDNTIISLILLGSPSTENINTHINHKYIFSIDFALLQAKLYIYNKKSNNINMFDFYDFLPFLKTKLNYEYKILTSQKNTKKLLKLKLLFENI